MCISGEKRPPAKEGKTATWRGEDAGGITVGLKNIILDHVSYTFGYPAFGAISALWTELILNKGPSSQGCHWNSHPIGSTEWKETLFPMCPTTPLCMSDPAKGKTVGNGSEDAHSQLTAKPSLQRFTRKWGLLTAGSCFPGLFAGTQ